MEVLRQRNVRKADGRRGMFLNMHNVPKSSTVVLERGFCIRHLLLCSKPQKPLPIEPNLSQVLLSNPSLCLTSVLSQT